MGLDPNRGKGFLVFFKAYMALAEVGTQVHELVRDGYLDWGPRKIDMRQLWPTQAQVHREKNQGHVQCCLDINAPQALSALKYARIGAKGGRISASDRPHLKNFQQRKRIRRQRKEPLECLLPDGQRQICDPLGLGPDDIAKEFIMFIVLIFTILHR